MPIKTIKDEVKITRDILVGITKEADDRIIVDFTVQKKDRDNEVLLIDGCDLREYRKNMIIQADHNFSVRSTVGSFKWLNKHPKSNPDRIRGLVRFATTPFARDVETLVREDHLKTLSHTFKGFEYTDDLEDIKQLGRQYGFDSKGVAKVHIKWAPLEISWITVPSNTDAMRVMADKGILKTKYFKDLAYEMKPYPNEHSARIKDPKLFNQETFRRKKDGTIYGSKKVPSTASVIWAKLKGSDAPEDNPIPQALRFPKANWTVAQAKKWLKDNNVKYERFEPATKDREEGDEEEEKITYKCIECGHKIESVELDEDIKCPECDSEMQMAEEPEPEGDKEDEEEEDLYSEENLEKSLKGNSINALMDLLNKIKKHTEEAEILAKSISETGQDSQPGSGDQNAEEEEVRAAIVVDSIKSFKWR